MSDPCVATDDHRGFRSLLTADPVPMLLASSDPVIAMRVRRDVLGQDVAQEIARMATLPARERVLRAGSGSGALSAVDPFAGTIVALLRIVDLGGALGDERVMSALHWLARAVAESSAEQRLEDLRWFARAARALVALGREDSREVEDLFAWFEAVVRADGGWLPLWVVRDEFGVDDVAALADPTMPSHITTTCAIARAFGASPRHRERPVVRRAGEKLLSAIGRDGRYPGEEAAAWEEYDVAGEHPSRYRALMALSLLSFTVGDPRLDAAIQWVIDRQGPDGRWEQDDALTLDVLVALKRLHESARACR